MQKQDPRPSWAAFTRETSGEISAANISNYERRPLLSNDTGVITTRAFNPVSAFWNVVKAFAGAGSFALPWAMLQSGLWTGVVGMVLISIISNYTMKILLNCGIAASDAYPERYGSRAPSYGDIAREALGRRGEILVTFLTVLVTMCVCVSYLILIGENMNSLIPKIPPAGFIWMTVPLVSLLTFLPDLKYLGFTSILGALSLLLAIGTVIYYGFDNHLSQAIDTYPAFEWRTLPLWFGVASFFFCDHIIVVPIANASGDPKRFPRVLDASMVFVTIANVAFAGMAYAFFREGTQSNVIKNLPCTGALVGIVRVCICIELLFSFPLVNASGLGVLETTSEFVRRHFSAFPHDNEADHTFSRNVLYYVFRVLISCFLALIATTISFFGYFVSLVGALMLATAGFILPPLFHYKMFPEQSSVRRTSNVLLIVFGIFATAIGTFLAVREIYEAIAHPTTACPCGCHV